MKILFLILLIFFISCGEEKGGIKIPPVEILTNEQCDLLSDNCGLESYSCYKIYLDYGEYKNTYDIEYRTECRLNCDGVTTDDTYSYILRENENGECIQTRDCNLETHECGLND